MFPRKGDLAHRHDATARASSSGTTAVPWRTEHSSGNNPSINNADPAWDRAAQAISDRLNAPNARIGGNHRIIEVDHHHAVIGNAVSQQSLDAAIRANAAMPIKVIHGYVRKDPNIHRGVQRGKLQFRQFNDDASVGRK
jgi:hypothetical protein